LSEFPERSPLILNDRIPIQFAWKETGEMYLREKGGQYTPPTITDLAMMAPSLAGFAESGHCPRRALWEVAFAVWPFFVRIIDHTWR
jgi:hypothetical protein